MEECCHATVLSLKRRHDDQEELQVTFSTFHGPKLPLNIATHSEFKRRSIPAERSDKAASEGSVLCINAVIITLCYSWKQVDQQNFHQPEARMKVD